MLHENGVTTSSSTTVDVTEPSLVYVKDKTHGWVPATIQQRNQKNDSLVDVTLENGDCIAVNLKDYPPSHQLPLRCIDGKDSSCSDLRDLAHLNEPSVLYNLRDRYRKNQSIYTRANERVLIAINPFTWIHGAYANQTRLLYAKHFVWNDIPSVAGAPVSLPPHLYEVSSLAIQGVQIDDDDQTIIVSGESGSGKTVATKIIMSHLATFHELKKTYHATTATEAKAEVKEEESTKTEEDLSEITTSSSGTLKAWDKLLIKYFSDAFDHVVFNVLKLKVKEEEDETVKEADLAVIEVTKSEEFDIEAPAEVIDDEPEEMKQTNLIVQKVLDSNPLLEAFGNAKTQSNDNSSRFSKHVKLQFDVQNNGPANKEYNIAGSTCKTFLLEKSRVVSHNKKANERTFHIFYQLMEAPEEDKAKVWKGLLGGKDSSYFKYIGSSPNVDCYTNETAWKNTIAALHTIGIHGKPLQTMLQALCIVMQLGNICFEKNPADPEGSIVENLPELDALSDLIGTGADDIAVCLTSKTLTAVTDTYKVPLTVAAAKATCDAFAKQIYATMFDWLVERVNEATCATKNYMFAEPEKTYRHVAILDLFGFECHVKNNFEQLLINHANERLQNCFNENVIESVFLEYEAEGITIDQIESEDNTSVLKFLEGKIGLLPLLNEECIRPGGSDAGFVNKLFANHSTVRAGSALIFKKSYNLSNVRFGIRHFARIVDYDADSFVEKNRDALSDDVLEVALKSKNNIVSRVSKTFTKLSNRKGNLVADSLWSKFERQMTNLFKSILKTKMSYVRCIIPNTDQEPMKFDLHCVMKQLHSMGLVTALKAHAAFPNKQGFESVLRRFWCAIPKEKNGPELMAKYRFGRIPQEATVDTLRKDCNDVLSLLLKDFSEDAFAVGKTKVYFKTGTFEHAEYDRSQAFDTNVTIIQSLVRGFLARKKMKTRQAERMLHKQSPEKLQSFFMPIFFLPLSLFRYMFGIKRRRNKFMRGCWH